MLLSLAFLPEALSYCLEVSWWEWRVAEGWLHWVQWQTQGNLFFKKRFCLFLAVLGLRCCTWAFSSCDEQGLLSSCSAWASHCGGFSCCGARALGHAVVSGCGTWAQLPHGIWDLARPGVEPVSLALADGFFFTVPPGKSENHLLWVLRQDLGLVHLSPAWVQRGLRNGPSEILCVYQGSPSRNLGADSESLTWPFPDHSLRAVSRPPFWRPGLSAHSPVARAVSCSPPQVNTACLWRGGCRRCQKVPPGSLWSQWDGWHCLSGAVCTRYRLTCPDVVRLQCASSHRGLVLWPGVLRLLKEQGCKGRNRSGTTPACQLKNVILPCPWARNLAFRLGSFPLFLPTPHPHPGLVDSWGQPCGIRDLWRRFNLGTRDQAWLLKNFCVAKFY